MRDRCHLNYNVNEMLFCFILQMHPNAHLLIIIMLFLLLSKLFTCFGFSNLTC